MAEFTKKVAEVALSSIVKSITAAIDAMKKGKKVQLIEFGTFF